MEVLNGFVIAMIPLLTFALMTGWAAWSLNRKFWPWFVAGLFLPFIGVVIILCLPANEKKVQQALLKPVSSEEIFDRVLELEEPRRINGSEVQFSARA
jgi:hypothetical protein